MLTISINYDLPQPNTTICYLFFKNQDQNTVKQVLRALLHQLLTNKPDLARHIDREFQKDGENGVALKSSLWRIFESVINDKERSRFRHFRS